MRVASETTHPTTSGVESTVTVLPERCRTHLRAPPRSSPPRSSGIRSWAHRQHRTPRSPNDALRDAAEKEALGPGEAPCGHDDQVGLLVPRRGDDLLACTTLTDHGATLRVTSGESLLELAHLLASEPLALGQEQSEARRYHVRIGVADERRLVNVEQDHFRAESKCEARGFVHGCERGRREIRGCENPSDLHVCRSPPGSDRRHWRSRDASAGPHERSRRAMGERATRISIFLLFRNGARENFSRVKMLFELLRGPSRASDWCSTCNAS